VAALGLGSLRVVLIYAFAQNRKLLLFPVGRLHVGIAFLHAEVNSFVTSVELDVQVLHIERVLFDEFAAGFDVFAHHSGEYFLTLSDVFELD
jgi:hypothetical protein